MAERRATSSTRAPKAACRAFPAGDAALLRLPTLGAQSFWTDEGATWIQVSGSLADVIARTAADNYPPLFNLLAWACVQAFGEAEWAMRFPSALLGIANVWLLYALVVAGPFLLLALLTLFAERNRRRRSADSLLAHN